ncbi:MAG: hypothetical protein A2016_05255 [Elusimicrobia bacterium GWF2_62_30]|nr:MAG: hypothetical protein A2016_05255 [Elusimicrobia bacterium GWF2_62_30]
MKKIALVYTLGGRYDEILPPLWALALATYMRQAAPGIKVDILDEQVLGAKRLAGLLARRYDLAGFSPVTQTYGNVLKFARVAKKNGSMVVFGGHYASALKKEILANRGPGSADYCLDAIVCYDGEKALHELARGTPFGGIKNLVYLTPGGQLAENPVEIMDFSRLPPVDYTLLDLERYFKIQERKMGKLGIGRTLSFIAQRGCKWAAGAGRCIFCGIQTMGGVRCIPPESAARQLSSLYRKYGVRHVYEAGDDYPANPAWLREFSAAASRLKMPALEVYAKATTLNPANAALLKAAGVKYVCVGVESFSDDILRRLNKGASAAVSRRAVSVLLEAGLIPNTALILGLPGETRETLSLTLSELKKIGLPPDCCQRTCLNIVAICPGTRLWQMLLEKEPKYRGQDLPDSHELRLDYLKHFCEAGEADLEAALKVFSNYFAARAKAGRPGRGKAA